MGDVAIAASSYTGCIHVPKDEIVNSGRGCLYGLELVGKGTPASAWNTALDGFVYCRRRRRRRYVDVLCIDVSTSDQNPCG